MPKSPRRKDPHAEREAQQYDNPIPSREYILQILGDAGAPLPRDRIAELLEVSGEEQDEALRRRLRAMERDGQLICNRRGAYGLVERMDLVRGRVQGHRDGFGFLVTEKGSDDLYLSARQMALVFDGDEVLASIVGTDRRGRKEGKIVEVLSRNTRQVVGRFVDQGDVGCVVPENPRINHDIIVSSDSARSSRVRDGQYVMVAITAQPGRHSPPRGEVVEILGDHMAPGMEVEVAIRSCEIPFQWPDEALAEAQALEPEPSEKDKQGRIDIRHLPLVTIDGEDAKDFDDAVCCEPRKGGGWRLWVAIADVSHYVRPGSALDQEARHRATSVYFPDRVVPMLPEALSNGLCSLKPKVDRLCMVCEMTISANGRLSGYQFFEGVMHSRARLTYNQVAAMLDPEHPEHAPARAAHTEALPHVEELYRLYQALRDARAERGAIDFDTVETRVVFSAERKIERIVPVLRNDAHRLIEECMLCANVATARFLEKLRLPALYRVHEGPAGEKLTALRQFLGELGLSLGGGAKPSPADYQALLAGTRERPDAHIIQTVMLRSLTQARYQPENKGHFGLHYPAYTHFTSPIRRYPDLLVHRALRFVARGGGGAVMRLLRGGRSGVQRGKGARALPREAIYPYDDAALVALGEHCSMAERRADEATRDVMAWLKCEYLQDRVGEVFDGVVSAVTGFGLFVELKDVYVEGLVHISALQSDYYHFDASRHCLVGEKSGQAYRLGDAVVVRVARVDLDDRKVDLDLVAAAGRKSRGKVSAAGAGAGKGRSGKDGKDGKGQTRSRSRHRRRKE